MLTAGEPALHLAAKVFDVAVVALIYAVLNLAYSLGLKRAVLVDILIVAAGFPQGIKADMVKEGAVVIDVGINQIDDPSRERGWRMVGDVDYKEVRKKASAITPVPNGIGPMTIALLLYNTVWSAKRKHGLE